MAETVRAPALGEQLAHWRSQAAAHKRAIHQHRRGLQMAAAEVSRLEALCARLGIAAVSPRDSVHPRVGAPIHGDPPARTDPS